jgi:hypothetical protein
MHKPGDVSKVSPNGIEHAIILAFQCRSLAITRASWKEMGPPGGQTGGPAEEALRYGGAELHSGIHFISLRSYLKPLAFLRASLFEFMTRYHLLLFLFVT